MLEFRIKNVLIIIPFYLKFAVGSFIYIKNVVIDQRETEMMSVRWKFFQFNVQIEQNDQKEIPQCARCFASLVLN